MDRCLDQKLAFGAPSDKTDDVDTDVDRRRHVRNVRVMRVAKLSGPQLHAEGLGVVRDVSPGGMMIDAHFSLDIGQSVAIALLDDHQLTGTVAWKDGNLLGVRFATEIPVDQILAKPSIKQDGKRARHPRFVVHKQVHLNFDTLTVTARMHDISQRGAKLNCEGKFRVHTNLLVRIADHRPVSATIKWRAGEMLGVEFHRLLAVEELEKWLRSEQAD